MSAASQFCIATGGPSAFYEQLNRSWNMLESDATRTLGTLIDKFTGGFHQGGKWNGAWTQNYLGM